MLFAKGAEICASQLFILGGILGELSDQVLKDVPHGIFSRDPSRISKWYHTGNLPSFRKC